MSGVPHPRLVLLDDWRHYLLTDPWTYTWEHGGSWRALIIPAGFVLDLASVPRVVWALIAPWDLRASSLPHDWIYRHQGDLPEGSYWIDGEPPPRPWTRKEGDKLMARVMRESGVARWRRRAAYGAVRLAGWAAWRRNREEA